MATYPLTPPRWRRGSGRLCGRGCRDRGSPEGRRLRRGRRAGRRAGDNRSSAEAASHRTATLDGAPATSSSVSGRIGSVDIDFLSGPRKTGTFNAPSAEQMAREGAVWLEPPRSLVQRVNASSTSSCRQRLENTLPVMPGAAALRARPGANDGHGDERAHDAGRNVDACPASYAAAASFSLPCAYGF